MIIEIDDSVEPDKRRELLKTLPIMICMKKSMSMQKTAQFLGYSYRYVRNTVNEYEYLRILKNDSCKPGRTFDSKLWGNYDRRS